MSNRALPQDHRVTARVKSAARTALPPGLRFALWNTLAYTPGLSEAYIALDPTLRPRRVTAKTQLIIEAFPRSGNTYSRAAFQHANGTDIAITSNFHTPRTVELGIRRKIPTIVLIRTPSAAAGSALQFHPDATPGLVLKSYQRFYRRILPCVPNVVVADFSEVITSFGDVVVRLNERFGTSFVPYVKTPEAEAAVDRAVEAAADVFTPGERPYLISKPSPARKTAEEVLAGISAADREELTRATALYETVLRASGAPSAHLGDLKPAGPAS